MIFGIIGISIGILILGYELNALVYAGLSDYYNSDYYNSTTTLNNKEVLKKKRILLILALVPFLLTVLTMVYVITILPVKAFLKEWRGE